MELAQYDVIRTIIQIAILPIVVYIAYTSKYVFRLVTWHETAEGKFDAIYNNQTKLYTDMTELKSLVKSISDSSQLKLIKDVEELKNTTRSKLMKDVEDLKKAILQDKELENLKSEEYHD
jgi:hypothetical protein